MIKKTNQTITIFVLLTVLIAASTAAADLSDGLVAHWELEGNANDSAGTNHGTIHGATTTTGQIGDALAFDGSGDNISYGDIRDYDLTCGSCRKEYPVTVKASDTFNFTPYPTKDVLSKEIKVKLPMTEGVTAVVKQPTLADEISATRELGSRPNATSDMITETLIIVKFEQNIDQKVEPVVYNERADILDAYLSLPAQDKRKIYEAYVDNFGKYGIELKMKSYCQHCGYEEVADIDLVSAFFRVLYSI